jgi:NAD(P)-dependent dehydrogenase (short-subunit alcohol dehydrogenase family)
MPAAIDARKLLRPGLLEGVSVLVAAPPGPAAAHIAGSGHREGSLALAVNSTCAALGARVSAWTPRGSVDAQADLLVVDCAGAFAPQDAHAGAGSLAAATPRDALRGCLDGAWEATRAVANDAFIEPRRPGRIVYLAPATSAVPEPSPGARADSPAQPPWGVEYAEAARAGLENLARTLSIEWARYAITLVTIAPGERTSGVEVAALTAYLGSPAGAYFSGCLFDLSGPGAAAPC